MALISPASHSFVTDLQKNSVKGRSQLSNGETFDVSVIAYQDPQKQTTVVVHSASPSNLIHKQLCETIPLEGTIGRKSFKRTADPYINIICDGSTRQVHYAIAFWNATQDGQEVTLGIAFRPEEPDRVFYFDSSKPKSDNWAQNDSPNPALLALRESMLDLAADILPVARALRRSTKPLLDAPMIA